LVKIGVARGRKTRPDLKVGICGEHGGDPASVGFCHEIGLDYVSCSPYRVPIARLAAAQPRSARLHPARRRVYSTLLETSCPGLSGHPRFRTASSLLRANGRERAPMTGSATSNPAAVATSLKPH
jgi:hypothetical protein